MASQVPPKRNTAFDLGFTLYKNDGTLIANPTSLIPQISKDFGNYAAISSVSVEDTTYGQVKAALTATEMDADVVMVYVTDAASGTVPFTATLYTAANLLDGVKIETSSIYAAANSLVAHVSPAVSSIYGGMATAAGLTIVDDFLDTEVSSILGNVVAIKAKTDIIPASPAPLGGAMTLDAATWLNLGLVASGTAQSATATTLVLAAASAFADDELNGAVVVITGGTGVGQSRVITNYTGSTDTAEVDAWTTTPSGTITYAIFAAAPASATSLPAVNVTQIAGSAVATGTAQLGVNVVSVTNDAITAAALADDVTTELQSGLATAATVNSLTAYVSPGISSIYEGMATAAALTVVDDFLDTEVSSILGNAVAIQAAVSSVTAYVNPGISSIKGDTAAALARTNSIVAYVSPGISSIYNALDVEIASIKGDTAAVLLRANSLIAHVSPAISSIYGGMATAAALATVDDFLDTEVSSLLGYASAITAQTALLPSSPAAAGDAMTLTDAAVDAVLDEPVEGAYTLRQALRLVLAVNAGKVSGAGTSSITIRDINDTADRITAEVDASGNRATVTKNVS